jgi:glycosyltransferase involved in cell wall biosynthesis
VRLAFLSPLPPAPTGIADYSAEVLALLAERHEIDAYHSQPVAFDLPRSVRLRPVEELAFRHLERAYDVVVHQIGNGSAHAFQYGPLVRFPGLLVLHDLVLHHSRARAFLDSDAARAYAADPASALRRAAALPALAAYTAEVDYSYPAQAGRLAQAQLGTSGRLLPYAYPMFRIPVEASRLVAVHNEYMAEAVRAEVPAAEVVRVAMPAAPAVVPAEARDDARRQLGLSPGHFVVGSFGLLTPEKQVELLARTVRRAAAARPELRLLLVGPVPEPGRLERMLVHEGVHDLTVVAGRVALETLPAYIEAADLVVHLRYPTARETSAALLRVLAQGRPAVVSDLEHLGDIPSDAVLRADVTDEEGDVTRAILRLAGDPAARLRLGEAARAFVAREHSPARAIASYEDALERARRRPAPPTYAWPAHLRA